MIADQSVRQQVLNITQSFLVQAPAGSGKTSLLVQRYLTLLANVQQYPEEILAMTFTRKAEAEMRARVLAALKLGQQELAPENEYEQTMWRLGRLVVARDAKEQWDILDNPMRLKIQTIDSLCSSIAGQLPVTAQFGSKPQIETDAEILYQTAVRQFMQQNSQDVPWLHDLNLLLGHLDNNRVKVARLLVKILQVRDQWLAAVFSSADPEQLRQTLEQSLQAVADDAIYQVIESCPDILDFDLLRVFEPETLSEWINVANLLLTLEGTWRKKVESKQGFPSQKEAKNKEEKQQFKERKEAMLQMLNALENHPLFRQHLYALTKLPPTNYSAAQWQVLQALFKILPILVAQLTIVFKEQGQVDFTAITLAALRALDAQHENFDLSLALDCKINHILVDEFQDTSHMQFVLLEKLTINWDPNAGKTLFLVGDPMQSIYRFRKAEVGLYLIAKKYGINAIKLNVAQLTVNFRSSAALVAWFNNVFGYSFPAEDSMDYGAISYLAASAAATKILQTNAAAVQGFNVPVELEPQKIVEIIREIKQNNPTQTIAILVRAKSHLLDIIPTLRAANIAFQAVELEALQQSPIIQDLLALTKALLHFDDKIAWLAALRAPWCGLELADLLVLAQAENTIWQTLQQEQIKSFLTADAQFRLQHFITCMHNAIAAMGRDLLDLIVAQLWRDLGAEQCFKRADEVRQIQAFFEFLGAIANTRDIYNTELLETKLLRSYLPSVNFESNAVQIMTMHKAKGLEFDTVILPGLNRHPRHEDQKLLLIEQRHMPQKILIMAPIKSETETHDAIYKYVAWCEQQRHTHENLRLLYVAATRAKHNLFCLASVTNEKPAAHSLLTHIWPVVGPEFALSVVSDTVDGVLSNAEDALQVKAVKSQKLPEFIKRFKHNWYSYNKVAIVAPNIIASAVKKPINSAQRCAGIVLHRALCNIAQEGIEHCDLTKIIAQQKIWQQHLQTLGLDPQFYGTALSLIQHAIKNTINDEFGRFILSKHKESYAEWSLTIAVQDMPIAVQNDSEQLILDRAFLDRDNKFWIVDYKLVENASEIPAASQLYSKQLQQYVNAVQNLRPELQICAGLYFPLQAQWVAISL